VLVLVSVIVALGFVWKQSGGAGLPSGRRGGQSVVKQLPPAFARRLRTEKVGRFGGGGLQPGRLEVVIRAVVVEAAAGAVAVAIDVGRRRRRQVRRRAQLEGA
jgi:hypothetical protein